MKQQSIHPSVRIKIFGRYQQTMTGPGGFTLIEVLIAIFILGIVMGTVYTSYTATLHITKGSIYKREIYSMARLALSRIMGDLGTVSPAEGRYQFKSERYDVEDREFSNLIFTSAGPLLGNEVNQGRVALIEYKIEKSEEGDNFILRRRESFKLSSNASQEADDADQGFIICKNIKYFEVITFDAKGKESESWDSTSGFPEQRDQMPSRIKIRMGFVVENNPDDAYAFSTEVYMPVTKVGNEAY